MVNLIWGSASERFPADAAIVLGFSSVRETFFGRVNLAANLYKEGQCKKLLLSGRRWGSLGEYTSESRHLSAIEAVEMYKLALELGVDDKDILLETNSYNTLGNLLFAYEQFISPFAWSRLLVISGPEHLRKVEGILSALNFPDEISFCLRPCEEQFSIPLAEEVMAAKGNAINLQRSNSSIDILSLKEIGRHPYYKK